MGRPTKSDYRGGIGRTTVSSVTAVDPSSIRHAQLVAHNLRLARAEFGFSQEVAAARLDPPVSRHHYNEWERGKHDPKPASKRKLELLYEKPYGWFDHPHDEEGWRVA